MGMKCKGSTAWSWKQLREKENKKEKGWAGLGSGQAVSLHVPALGWQ